MCTCNYWRGVLLISKLRYIGLIQLCMFSYVGQTKHGWRYNDLTVHPINDKVYIRETYVSHSKTENTRDVMIRRSIE